MQMLGQVGIRGDFALRGISGQIVACEADRAVARGEKPGQQAEQRRFLCPVWAKQGAKAAFFTSKSTPSRAWMAS